MAWLGLGLGPSPSPSPSPSRYPSPNPNPNPNPDQVGNFCSAAWPCRVFKEPPRALAPGFKYGPPPVTLPVCHAGLEPWASSQGYRQASY